MEGAGSVDRSGINELGDLAGIPGLQPPGRGDRGRVPS